MELKGILCTSHYHKLSRKNVATWLSVLKAISVPGLELLYLPWRLVGRPQRQVHWSVKRRGGREVRRPVTRVGSQLSDRHISNNDKNKRSPFPPRPCPRRKSTYPQRCGGGWEGTSCKAALTWVLAKPPVGNLAAPACRLAGAPGRLSRDLAFPLPGLLLVLPGQSLLLGTDQQTNTSADAP